MAHLDPRYAHLRKLEEPLYDEPRVELNESLDNCIIIDGLPQVDDAKYDKLCALIAKKLAAFGPGARGGAGFVMPKGPDGQTMGFGFYEFAEVPSAAQCAAELNGKPLDKKHTFRINALGDAKRSQEVPDEYSPPDESDFQDSVNLHDWLEDPMRDQYVVRCGDYTDVYWNDLLRKGDPMDLVESREHWSDAFVQWSPKGTYLATTHKQGVQLWGGPQWTKLAKFGHEKVTTIQFSPCESFLVTYDESSKKSDDKCIRMWDVRASKLLRTFGPKQTMIPGEPGQPATPGVRMPQFLWSATGRYVARMTEKSIAVYETPSMELCDKQALRIANVRGFSWSPSDDVLAYWVAEQGDIPAKVVLLSWPSRELLAQKNLFNVCDATMEWHPQGDFLCVRVSRFTKSKKSTFTNFEIFRTRGRSFPVESLEVKDNVIDFSFEPRGTRFLVIRGAEPLCTVDMYNLGGVESGKLEKENSIEKKPLNKSFWSPAGGIVLLAGVKSLNGTLEWYEAESLERIGTGEHFMITDISWDPTGRYVVTAVSHFRSALEAAYQVWTSHGTLVTRQAKEKFFQLLWRPRPPSLVTPELEADIAARLKEYSKRYDKEDQSAEQSALDDLKAEREEQRIEFAELCKEWFANWNAQRKRRAEVRNGPMSDAEEDWEEIEVTEEEILRQDEEVIDLAD